MTQAPQITPCNGLQEGEDMADDDALFQKGMPIRREVLPDRLNRLPSLDEHGYRQSEQHH